VVTPGKLQSDSVKQWLGGLEPAWTLLEYDSFTGLRRPPSPTTGPIRLAADLAYDEIERSAVARNALVLLSSASSGAGLKTTASGNLSRAVVAEMCERFTWPDFDRRVAFEFNKVINEPDFLPLYLVRHLAQTATLLRRHKGHLEISPAGRRLIEASNVRALQAVLFHTAFWHFNVEVLGRGLHHGWLQRDVGIILWCISVSANDWQPPTRLSRLCTIPIDGVLDQKWDTASYEMEAQILRPLQWFSLLEHREEKSDTSVLGRRSFYRKTALFDRFLSFDVRLEGADSLRH
jgi:hypothetical protein